jgi:hypothetical protein
MPSLEKLLHQLRESLPGQGEQKKLSIKSFSGDDEMQLLQEFSDMLKRWATDDNKLLVLIMEKSSTSRILPEG